MASTLWISGCTAKNTTPINMLVISRARKFVELVLGEPTMIVIERVGESNRASLRVALHDGLAEFDVKAVYALMRRRRSRAWQLEQLMALVRMAA